MYRCILIAMVFLNVYSHGDNICKVPKGDVGKCVNILRCKPLWDMYNKKHKTDIEDTFIRQSYCGNINFPSVYVCCPSVFTWHNFQANPVEYPKPFDDLSEIAYIPTTRPHVANESKVDKNREIPKINTTQSAISPPIPIADLSEDTSNPTQPEHANETIVDKSKKNPNINATQLTVSPPIPITNLSENMSIPTSQSGIDNETTGEQSTETNIKINEVVPLSRDSPNATNTMTNNEEDDDFQSLSLLNRNNKMTCGDDYVYGSNKITGGDATAIDEYPWLVLLEYKSGALGCGGSLITPRFVLTAAHCANSRLNGIPAFARLAEYNTTSFPTDIVEVDGGGFEEINVTIIPVENVWAHPNFKHVLADTSIPESDDIGLIKLLRDADFSDFINVICLPHKDFITEFEEGLYLSVAGWGDDKLVTVDNDVKKHVTVPYVPLDKCKTIHARALVDSQICAGGEMNKDSCVGDSGGPLMYSKNRKKYLVGIVSYGSVYCGTKGQPGIYTNVHKYLKWISDIINNKQ